MNAPNDLAAAERRLSDVEAQRATWVQKQAEIERAIADAPDWQSLDDGRARDREYDGQQNLQLQLRLLAEGRLFRAPGVTFGQIGALDARIAALTDRRDRAARALDGVLRQGEALFAATVTTSA